MISLKQTRWFKPDVATTWVVLLDAHLRFSGEGLEVKWCTSPDALLDVSFTLGPRWLQTQAGRHILTSGSKQMCGDYSELHAVHICTY